MGITGLLPFLDKCSRKTHISEFSGQTVAVDTYCWLHKGAFSCADKIIMGQATDVYIKYCMKFVNMLLNYNIKPILVFDGKHLPAKAEIEIKRKKSRLINRKRASELLKIGNISEGKNLLRRSLDVTHKMALDVIKECQARNIDCIVAPYEADAQLAYLNLSGIAEIIITEDSDLILFGCKKIIFKMDIYGHGILVEQERLHLSMGLTSSNFNMDKFLYMCILSGCDYLASLPGIGLSKACKFVVRNTEENIYNALLRLPTSLNMKSLIVTKEYRDKFMRALLTFKHQLVYCPLNREQVRLNNPMTDVTHEQLEYAGSKVDAALAWQLALGNYDPCTYEKLHDFDPDRIHSSYLNTCNEIIVTKHSSIWSQNFKVRDLAVNAFKMRKEKEESIKTFKTARNITLMKTESSIKYLAPKKRRFEEFQSEVQSLHKIENIIPIHKQSEKKLLQEVAEPSLKTLISNEHSSNVKKKSSITIETSNILNNINNELNEASSSFLHKIRRRLPIKSRLKETVIDKTAILHSKFFVSPSHVDIRDKKSMNIIQFTYYNDEKNIINKNLKDLGCIINEKNTDKESSIEIKSNTSATGFDNFANENGALNSVNSKISPKNKNYDSKDNPNSNDSISDIESGGIAEDTQFLINREFFDEYKSSMFNYESLLPNERMKSNRTSLPTSNRSSHIAVTKHTPSTLRSIKRNSKKNSMVGCQQKTLTMFGFEKKYP